MAEKPPLALSEGEVILWTGAPATAILGVWIVTKVVGFPLAGTFLIFWAYFFFGGIWAAASGRRDFNPFEGVGGTLLLAAPVLFLLGCGYCWRAGAERLLPTGRRYGAKAWIA